MKRKRPRFGYGDIRTGELEHVEKVVETGHRSSGSPKGWGFSMRRLAKKKKEKKEEKKKKTEARKIFSQHPICCENRKICCYNSKGTLKRSPCSHPGPT